VIRFGPAGINTPSRSLTKFAACKAVFACPILPFRRTTESEVCAFRLMLESSANDNDGQADITAGKSSSDAETTA